MAARFDIVSPPFPLYAGRIRPGSEATKAAPLASANVITVHEWRRLSKWAMRDSNPRPPRCKRDLSDKEYAYIWADGIHFNIRLEEGSQCILVLKGATADGNKELIGIIDGYRESKQSWSELLIDLKHRGLKVSPKISVGDGALAFWAAIREVLPDAREQQC